MCCWECAQAGCNQGGQRRYLIEHTVTLIQEEIWGTKLQMGQQWQAASAAASMEDPAQAGLALG